MLRNWIISCAVVLATASTAQAEYVEWRDVGPWSINFYSSDKGCSAFRSYSDGTRFFIGFTTRDDNIRMEVLVSNKDWRSIKEGQNYDVSAQFDNLEAWDINMKGGIFGDEPGLSFSVDAYNPLAGQFAEEFQGKSSMTWRYKRLNLGTFSLQDSRAAFTETLKCQRSYNQAISGARSDPFASGGSNDPFSQ